MDDNTFGGEFVGELNDDDVSGDSINRWTRELAVDGHNDAFFTIWPPELILNLPLQFYNSGGGRVNRHQNHRY